MLSNITQKNDSEALPCIGPDINHSPIAEKLSGPARPFQSAGIYIAAAILTALILLVGYQQVQLGHLSSELNTLRGDVRGGETRGHLEALDAKLQEMNTRLTYLDSKIMSTDQKAQSALDRIKANEEKADWLGNFLRGLGWK